MDKFKNVAKGGWHPSGDRAIHRDSWKSDLKGMATNRNKDPYEAQKSHQSAPLASLKDPDSFGPPPKHSGWYGNNGTPTGPAGSSASSGGLGSAIKTPARIPTREQQEQQAAREAEKPNAPPGPSRVDTTGRSTANLPKPPVRRDDGNSPAPPPRNTAASPPVPPRQVQARPAQTSPPPVLPPRQNEHPDEYTPPPPPTYQEATTVQPAVQPRPAPQNPATINGVAANRLAQAGVNVPGFGIGGNNASSQAAAPQSPSTQGHPSQLSELQQRFSRMGTSNAAPQQAAPPPASPSTNMTAVAQKKPPPPPPPKKAGLGSDPAAGATEGSGAPPPLPLSSKPRPS